MNKNTNKLKMNITGSFHGVWSSFFLKNKVKKLGLNVDEMKHKNIHHTEMIISGDRELLWKAVDSVKTPSYLLKMDRIILEFTN